MEDVRPVWSLHLLPLRVQLPGFPVD
jgi:hypothetical protein